MPEQVREQARQAYQRFRRNPDHSGLRFKRVHSTQAIYSVRISLSYRALGVLEGDEMIWFWIGSHQDYDELLRYVGRV